MKNEEERTSIRPAHSVLLYPGSHQSNSKPIVTAPFMKHGAGVTLLPMLSSSRARVCVGVRACVCVRERVRKCASVCVSAYWGHVWVFIQARACDDNE